MTEQTELKYTVLFQKGITYMDIFDCDISIVVTKPNEDDNKYDAKYDAAYDVLSIYLTEDQCNILQADIFYMYDALQKAKKQKETEKENHTMISDEALIKEAHDAILSLDLMPDNQEAFVALVRLYVIGWRKGPKIIPNEVMAKYYRDLAEKGEEIWKRENQQEEN